MKRSQYKVHSRPQGWIVGAKFAFPMPVAKDKYQQMVMPVQARVVRVVVAVPDDPMHWAYRFAGTERYAVEIRVTGHGQETVFYVDNEDGKTPWRLTLGVQQQPIGMKQLPVERLVEDTSIKPFYTFTLQSTKRAKCQTQTSIAS